MLVYKPSWGMYTWVYMRQTKNRKQPLKKHGERHFLRLKYRPIFCIKTINRFRAHPDKRE